MTIDLNAIHTLIEGDGERSFLLLNGAGQSLRTWDHAVPGLLSAGRVIRFDVPGVGKSPSPGAPYSFEELGQAAMELAGRHGVGDLVATGHAWGARAAQVIARDFDIAASVTVVIDDELEAAYNQIKPALALYIGGMGAKGRNFYHDLACRYGFDAAADTIQQLYLQGRKGEAIARVPDALVDAVALVGSKARIRDRLQLWRDSSITTLNVSVFSRDALRFLAEELL